MAIQKRGLGRGLDALLGEISPKSPNSDELVAPDEAAVSKLTRNLPVEFLQRGKHQPRKDMNPDKLQELADSIRAQGIIQPIVVRPVGEEKYEIIAGERRWRAAQLAGLQEVPVLVRDIDDRAAMAIALIENIQREDLNPLEEADALRRLLDEFAMTHQQIADAVGKSRAAVSNLLRLIDLNPDVKKFVNSRQLEMGHARALLPLGESQQLSVAQKVVKDGLSVRATEQLVRHYLAEPKMLTPKRADPDTLRLQDELTAKLGAKVVIDHKENGGGKVVITYSSLDELDGIIGQIR